MSCSIVNVNAPNGKPSILYNDIHGLVMNPNRAIAMYMSVRGTQNIRFPDRNGEVPLREILSEIPGMTPLERAAFHTNTYRSPATESSLTHEQAKIQKSIAGIISQLVVKEASASTSDEREWYRNEIQTLRDNQKTLRLAKTIGATKVIAEIQINWVREVLQSRRPSRQKLRLAFDLLNGWSWTKTQKFLSEDQIGEEAIWNQTFQEINALVAPLQLDMHEMIIGNVRDKMSERGVDVSKEDITKIQGDIGLVYSMFFDMSRVDNTLAKYIDGILKDAARNQAGFLSDFSRKINEMAKGVNQQKLLQTDKKGNITGDLITANSSEYMAIERKRVRTLDYRLERARRVASDNENLESITARAYRDYYQSLRETDVLIDIRDLNAGGKKRQTLIKHLEQSLGKEEAAIAIDIAETRWNKYLIEKSAAKARIEAEATGGRGMADRLTINGVLETPSESMARKLREWELVNSPERYADEYSMMQETYYSKAEGFSHRVARKYKNDGSVTTHYDEKYDQLTEAEQKFLNYILQETEKFLAYLPRNLTKDLGAGFIPVVQKTLAEYVLGNGAWHEVVTEGAWNLTHKRLLESLVDPTVQELYRQEAAADEFEDDGNYKRRVPTAFLKDVVKRTNESAKEFKVRKEQSLKERSFDLVKVMEMFAGMAINYNHYNQVEDDVRLAERVLIEASEIRQKGGVDLHDRDGNLVELIDEKAGIRLKKAVAYEIDGAMYGQKKKTNEYPVGATLFSLSPAEHGRKKKKASDIELKRDALETLYADDKISTKEYKEQKEVLEEEYRALNGRNFSGGGALNNILKFTQAKGMGWNVTAGIANFGFGIMSNLIHAASGVDFNEKQILAAHHILLKSRTLQSSKAAAIMKIYNLLFEVTEIAYGTHADRKRYKQIDWLASPYEIQRRTEFLLQGASMVAQMMNKKVTDIKGNERALWDAYNEDGTWNVEEFGDQAQWNNILQGGDQNDFTKFRNKMIQVNKTLHGNYDPNSLVQVKAYVAGRALMMFKSWIAEGMLWRFGKENYDQQIGRTIKGRYTTVIDISKEHGVGAALSTFTQLLFDKHKQVVIDGKPISELDLQNMRSNIMEMKIWIGINVVMVMLAYAMIGDGGDDDEDTLSLATARILISQLYRVEADILFYMDPGTVSQILKNPIPAIKTVSDFFGAVGSTWDYTKFALADEKYGGMHPALKWSKTLPVTSQFYKMWYMGTHTINWDR